MKTFIASIAACFFITTAAAAQDVASEQVRVNDLNLNSVHGRRMLERRIANAATDVCQTENGLDLDADIDADRCRKAAEIRVAPAIAHAEAAYAAASAGAAASLDGR